MKLTNRGSADRGFAVKGGAPVICRVGETLDGDFDTDHPVMAAWIKEGSVSQSNGGAAPQVDSKPAAEPVIGYTAVHVAFGNYGVVGPDGVTAKDETGADVVFKMADGDAQLKAQAYADKLNTPAA